MDVEGFCLKRLLWILSMCLVLYQAKVSFLSNNPERDIPDNFHTIIRIHLKFVFKGLWFPSLGLAYYYSLSVFKSSGFKPKFWIF